MEHSSKNSLLSQEYIAWDLAGFLEYVALLCILAGLHDP
jgi:hypothetical protein